MGEYDFFKEGETANSDYGIEYITMHERYDTKTFENDIAVIKTDR